MATAVNTSKEMAEVPSCQACSKIMAVFLKARDVPAGHHSEYIGEVSDIIEMLCPHADIIRTMSERWSRSSRVWISYIHNVIIYILDTKINNSKLIRLVHRPDKPGHAGTSKVLDSQWADHSVPQAWYNTCLNEHGRKCQEPSWLRSSPGTITMPQWLVDVVDDCVVQCDSDTARYITLSYTWGGVQCLKHTKGTLKRLEQKGSLHCDQGPEIPRTVRDAMNITKLFGERYLWVDSLCVDQDEAAASKDLNSMHHIYAKSSLCLVALAGTDANYGLRGIQGVSAARQVKQFTFDIADGERVTQIEDPWWYDPENSSVAVRGSTYEERGWTYQEYVFAKRRLVFTDGPLRWICGCAHWGEELIDFLPYDTPIGLSTTSALWMADPSPVLEVIEKAAEGFNNRYFTYEEDTLRAFLGTQNHLGRNFHGGLNYGHPQIFFDISLTWTSKYPPLGLTRRHSADNLPSWSWMGWRGNFQFQDDGEYASDPAVCYVGFTHSVANWYSIHSPSRSASDMQPINCGWHDCRNDVEKVDSQISVGWEKVTTDGGSEHFCRRVPNDQSDYTEDRDLTRKYKYRVPLPDPTLATDPIVQRPFLFSKTTSACFVAKRLDQWNAVSYWNDGSFAVELLCRDGESAGFLEIHQVSDAHRFEAAGTVELVAVVKGWTTEFSRHLVGFQNQKPKRHPGIRGSARDEYLDARSRKWRHSCYFVLCVEWENGVAKRQASGKVEAGVWERNQKPVELILG